MGYSFKRERKETNFLRPRYTEKDSKGVVHNYKGLINVSSNKGAICWGVVDEKDNFIADNMQMVMSPWTGVHLPLTVAALKTAIKGR